MDLERDKNDKTKFHINYKNLSSIRGSVVD